MNKIMSNSDTGEGACISEVTLAISKARRSQAGGRSRILDSPDSDESGRSKSFTVKSYDYTDNSSTNDNRETPDVLSRPLTADDLRIPIVGYEVMEERARFTVYKLQVHLKNGDCWYVFRRYTDFVRLLSQLRRQKLAISHLSLPKKRYLGDNFAPTFLEERARGLQVFVNNLLTNPILVSNKSIRDFFCLDEPPALSDTAEEARAIFEALEDTIYHLRQQLNARDTELAAERDISNGLRHKLHQLMTKTQKCSKCGALENPQDIYLPQK